MRLPEMLWQDAFDASARLDDNSLTPIMFTPRFTGCKRNRERGFPMPAATVQPAYSRKGGWSANWPQTLRVSTKFWPVALVQLSWLVETRRQLKLIVDCRISEVPWISTAVAPVIE